MSNVRGRAVDGFNDSARTENSDTARDKVLRTRCSLWKEGWPTHYYWRECPPFTPRKVLDLPVNELNSRDFGLKLAKCWLNWTLLAQFRRLFCHQIQNLNNIYRGAPLSPPTSMASRGVHANPRVNKLRTSFTEVQDTHSKFKIIRQ